MRSSIGWLIEMPASLGGCSSLDLITVEPAWESPLPGVAGWLVRERVGDGVGAEVADPAEREGLELLELVLVAVEVELSSGFEQEVVHHLVGVPVVQHVAPHERLLVPPHAHLQREPGED